MQVILAELPFARLDVPLNNYVLLFYRSCGAYKTVLEETNVRDGDLWEVLKDWKLLLAAVHLVVSHTESASHLQDAVAHLAGAFHGYCATLGRS